MKALRESIEKDFKANTGVTFFLFDKCRDSSEFLPA